MDDSLDLLMEQVKKDGRKYFDTNERLKAMCEKLEGKIIDLLEEAGYEDDMFILLDQMDIPEPTPYYISVSDRLILTGIIPEGLEIHQSNDLLASIHWDVITRADYEELDDPALTGMLATKAGLFGSDLKGRRTFRIQFIQDAKAILSKIGEAFREDAGENEKALKLEKQLSFFTYLEKME